MRLAARLLSACLALAAAGAAAGPLVGFTSRDCASTVDIEALGAEGYAVHYPQAHVNDLPDILFDARATGGGSASMVLDQDNWSVQSQWRASVNLRSLAAVIFTMPGEALLDTGDFVAVDLGVAKPQPVGAMDGVRPQVTASTWGYEVRFKPLAQQTPDDGAGCAVAGDPLVDLRPVIGYNVYRLPGTGSPPLSQYRSAGWVGYVDARTLLFAVADADGLGCSDDATADETTLINPNGVLDDGDEVLAFRDTRRTPSGRPRANVPDAQQSYTYRIQPVLRGDPLFHAAGGTISALGLPVSSSDRDGNGSKESIDLLSDGRFEFVDPGMHGLGLTRQGEIHSSLQPGQATPGPVPLDPDADGIPTVDELALGLDPVVSNAASDSDGDGPLDLLEAESGSRPMLADADGSGERDGREMFYGRNPMNTCDDIVLGARPLGDVAPAGGGNGTLDVGDAVRLLRMSVGLEPIGDVDMTAGDIAPAELTDGTTTPPTWRRHSDPDGLGQHPYGYNEHGDGVIDVADAVLALRGSVGILRVTD